MSESTAGNGTPDFERLARETPYSRDEWRQAWAALDERWPWQTVIDLAPLTRPLDAANMLTRALELTVLSPAESTGGRSMTDNPVIRYAEMPDGPEFDEFIAHNARIHFERMGEAQFWLMVTVDGRDWHINCGAVNMQAKGYATCEEDA